MLNNIASLALAIAGIVFILLAFMLKVIVWQTEHFTFTLPLKACNNEIFDKICNIRRFCEFTGIHKKSTVVLINYGAPDWFLVKLLSFFDESFLKIIDKNDSIFKE